MAGMKVVADSFTNADKVLAELFEFEQDVEQMMESLEPYAVAGNGRALPRFISETSVKLRQSLVGDFVMSFPNINSLVENGNTASGSLGRLHDAIFKFDTVQKAVYAKKCVITVDKEREELCDKLRDVIGDICVFIIVQYSLYQLDTGSIPVSIHAHCEKNGVSPDVLFGIMKEMLAGAERSWYAYEPVSPMYTALNECDPIFLNECEEEMYPLTDEMAQKIVEGDMDVAYARSLLVAHSRSMTEREVDVTPSTLLEQMKLD